ncbi:uncharacterized protein LOC143022205 isoform X1 [Oratosquilla oratoria]|uniref:uncharacterized protein LOC143022205 isoform X1 n=1 Tax=Oratosquilla oratoria TaxID=337810 RepID=UPI003F763E70
MMMSSLVPSDENVTSGDIIPQEESPPLEESTPIDDSTRTDGLAPLVIDLASSVNSAPVDTSAPLNNSAPLDEASSKAIAEDSFTIFLDKMCHIERTGDVATLQKDIRHVYLSYCCDQRLEPVSLQVAGKHISQRYGPIQVHVGPKGQQQKAYRSLVCDDVPTQPYRIRKAVFNCKPTTQPRQLRPVDSVYRFVQEQCHIEENDKLATFLSEIYKAYVNFCNDYGLEAVSIHSLGRYMSKLYGPYKVHMGPTGNQRCAYKSFVCLGAPVRLRHKRVKGRLQQGSEAIMCQPTNLQPIFTQSWHTMEDEEEERVCEPIDVDTPVEGFHKIKIPPQI